MLNFEKETVFDDEQELSFEHVVETRDFCDELGVETACCFGLSEETELEQLGAIQSALEEALHEAEAVAVKYIGKCCMGYEWLPDGKGYRCAGGSHYETLTSIHSHMRRHHAKGGG